MAPGKVLAHSMSTSAAQESWKATLAQCDLSNEHASYKYTVTNYLRPSLTNCLFTAVPGKEDSPTVLKEQMHVESILQQRFPF